MAAKKKTAKKPSPKKRATTRKTVKKPAPKKTTTKAPANAKAAATARPTAGTTIERTFKGTKHTVQVTAAGYAYKGTEYRSLTRVAKAITGYASISGPRFFGTDEATAAKGGSK